MLNIMVGDERLFLFRRDIIFDTGSSFTYFPTIEFEKFFKVIINKHKCYKKDGLEFTYCQCADTSFKDWPTIKIKIGDTKGNVFWLFIRPEDYMMYNSNSECLLTVVEELPTLEGEYTILLGDPFLRAYYTIYDMD